MNRMPIILEICGIPYSRKTTTIQKISRHLRRYDIGYKIIDEFRGEGSFYKQAKYEPDLNLARSLRCLNQIVTEKYNDYCDVILIDRGIFDSYCWYHWFNEHGKASREMLSMGKSMLDIVQEYSSKYYIAWLDIEPAVSIAHHSHQGTIVNINTLTGLQKIYMKLSLKMKKELNISRIESTNVSSANIAEKLIKRFKLEKHSNN